MTSINRYKYQYREWSDINDHILKELYIKVANVLLKSTIKQHPIHKVSLHDSLFSNLSWYVYKTSNNTCKRYLLRNID